MNEEDEGEIINTWKAPTRGHPGPRLVFCLPSGPEPKLSHPLDLPEPSWPGKHLGASTHTHTCTHIHIYTYTHRAPIVNLSISDLALNRCCHWLSFVCWLFVILIIMFSLDNIYDLTSRCHKVLHTGPKWLECLDLLIQGLRETLMKVMMLITMHRLKVMTQEVNTFSFEAAIGFSNCVQFK